MALATLLLLTAPHENRAECAPTSGSPVSVDERFAHVSLDAFEHAYFSEDFNDAAAPLMGIKSRDLVTNDRAANGDRHRRVRMQPALVLPAPLRVFTSEEQLRYDEVSTFDGATHELHFVIEDEACDRLKYGGVISFTPDGDGVRLHIDALLQVDAPLVAGLVEGLISGGVRDGYAKHAVFMQHYLDAH